MDYVDKLLALYLAMDVDEQWQVTSFEPRDWARHLGIDKKALWRRLEGLRVPTGFVLAIKKQVALERGLRMPWESVTLNPTHPWLQGHRNFYIFCQFGGVTFYNSLGWAYSSNLPSDIFMETEGPSLEGFQKHIYHLVEHGFVEYVHLLARAPSRQDAKHQEPTAMEWLFEICMSLGLFVLQDIDISAQAPDLDQIDGLLESHVLKPAASGSEVLEEAFLLSSYVQELYMGTRWVLEKLLETGQKALAFHPDRLVASGQKKAKLMHFATSKRWRQLQPEQMRWGSVTGVAYFHIESDEHPAVIVQSTPERKDTQMPLNHGWKIASRNQMIPLRRFYAGSINHAWALTHELHRLEPSRLDYVRQARNPPQINAPNNWMASLEESAKSM